MAVAVTHKLLDKAAPTKIWRHIYAPENRKRVLEAHLCFQETFKWAIILLVRYLPGSNYVS